MSEATQTKNDVILEARGLHKSYQDATRELHVLRGVDLVVHEGEIVSIVGASGAGKSTLLHLLGALDRVSAGQIYLRGREISKLDGSELASIRNRQIGFVFQFHHLLAEFSALENVMMPAFIMGRHPRDVERDAVERLQALGLGDRLHHRPARLSGGEQQRVALARALINNPDLILADEPTGNLDTESAEFVINLLWRNVRENGRSLVIVTHEPEIARRADRCLRLRDGILHVESA